jgi:hypothetical protein
MATIPILGPIDVKLNVGAYHAQTGDSRMVQAAGKTEFGS